MRVSEGEGEKRVERGVRFLAEGGGYIGGEGGFQDCIAVVTC